MRCLLVLAGLLLASLVSAQYFVPGKEYVFEYQGRVASGLVGLPPQYGGLAFKSKVHVTVKDPENVVVHIQNPTIGQFREKLRSESAFYEEELPISYVPLPRFRKEMETPFVVTFRSGQVTSIKMSEKIPTAIQNIHKAIASLIQLNINGVERFPEPSKMILPMGRDNSKELAFSIMEENLMGTCETLYNIATLPEYLAQAEENQIPRMYRGVSDDEEEHLVVTKTINYHNCLKKSSYQHVAPTTEHCQFPEANCKRFESSSSYTRFLLKGTRHNFVVKAIWNHGKFITRPAQTDLSIFSFQTLFLKDLVTKEAPRVPDYPSQGMNFDYGGMNPMKNDYVRYPVFPIVPTSPYPPNAQNTITKVMELLATVSRHVEDYSKPTETQITLEIHTIVKSLRTLGYDDLKALAFKIMSETQESTWTMYYQSSSKEKETQRQILLDCLAYTGTNPSILVIKDLIAQKHLTGERAAQVIMTIPMTLIMPHSEFLTHLFELTQIEQVKSNWQLYSTSLLTVSNLMYQACVNLNSSRSSYPANYERNGFLCHPDEPTIINKLIPTLEKFLRSTNRPYEQEVALRALGNIAHRNVIPILKEFSWGSDQLRDVQVRTMAVFSLDRCAKLYPEDVREIMLPIATNTLDHYEVRIAAMTVLFKTGPPMFVFEKIALMTWFEPSEQVNSYIYSTFKSLSNTTYPKYNETEKAIKSKMALYLTKPVQEGLQYSHNILLTDTLHHEDLASKLRLYSIGSKDSLIPRRLLVRLYNYIHGYTYKPFMFSFFNQGTQRLLNQLLFPEEVYHASDSSSFLDIWSTDQVSDILKKIKIDYKEAEEPRGRLHMKLFGHLERIFSYDETTKIVKELLHNRVLDLSNLEGNRDINIQKVLPSFDSIISVPTEVGLPILITYSHPTFMSVRGQVKTTVNPKQLKPSTILANEPPFSFTMDADLKPMVSVHRIFTSYVFTPFFDEHPMVGFEEQFQAGLPGKFFFNIDTSAPRIQYQFTPLELSDYEVVHYHMRPFTTIYNPVSVQLITKSDKFLPINRDHKLERPIDYTYKFGQQTFGLDLVGRVFSDRQVMDFSTFYNHMLQRDYLTLLTFSGVRSGPIYFEEYGIVYKPKTSETKTFKIQQTRHIEKLSSLRSESDYRPSRYDMYRRTEVPLTTAKSMLEVRPPRDLSMASEFKDISYEGEHLYQYLTSVNMEGSANRQYMAVLSFANKTTTELRSHKLSLELQRVKSPHAQPAKISLVSELQYPTHKERTIREFIQRPVYANGWADIHFPENRKIHVGIKMRRNDIQRQYLEVSPEVVRCEENENKGFIYSHNCTLARIQASTVNEYLVETVRSGEPLSPFVRNVFNDIDTFFKVVLYPHMHNNVSMTSHSPSTVYFNFTRSPFQRTWNVSYVKPYETTNFTNLYEYGPIPFVLPFNTYIPNHYILPNMMFKGQWNPICNVQSKYLRTFDNITIPIQTSSPKCWHLLAQTHEIKMGVYVKPEVEGKEVKVILGNTEVRFVPANRQPKVYLNGKEIKLTNENIEKPIYKFEGKYVMLKLTLRPSGAVLLESPLYRIAILHDGSNVLLEMFNEHRNRVSGLCGDLNGEWNYDLKSPAKCTYNRTMVPEFFRSWIVKSESCQPMSPREEKCYVPKYIPTGELSRIVKSRTPMRHISMETSKPYEMKVIEIEGNKPGYECYSLKPVKVCKKSYKPEEKKPVKVEFYCAPKGMYVPPEKRHVDRTMEMQLPTKCIKK